MQEFAHITHWALDQDGTLYHPRHEKSVLIPQLWVTHNAYIAQHVPALANSDPQEVFVAYMREHGSIQLGLQAKHGVDCAHYSHHVHAFDERILPACPQTAEGVGLLPGTRLIFTNAPRDFTTRVQAHLGVLPHIHGTFSIEDTGYMGKPAVQAYEAFLQKFGPAPGGPLDPRRVCMVENSAPNLVAAHALGMTTVHIYGDGPPLKAPYIDYSFPTINDFLRHVAGPALRQDHGLIPPAALVRGKRGLSLTP